MAYCDVCGNFDNDEGAIGNPNYQPDLLLLGFPIRRDLLLAGRIP